MPRLLPLLLAAAAAAPCDLTIPGRWLHESEAMALAWTTPGRAFSAVLPTGRFTNATLSLDNATVAGAWSTGHTSQGAVSAACDAIAWADGSRWRAAPPPIRVHIAPHSHNDVGWGETYLQYYWGNGPYPAAIRNVTRILSLVIEGLLADPARRFAQVEQAFFQLYWASLTPAAQADVRGLVARRQLVFLGGGWSMSDEAAPSYIDMLDNYATGHRHIAAEFGQGALPTLAWQIDPFGHSGFQGVLSSPLGGFQGVMWGREPGDFKAACRPARALERVWLPSASLGAGAATFGATFYDPGYDWPAWNRCTSTSNASQCTRAQGRADALAYGAAEVAEHRAPAVRGSDVLINFGTDFAWINAVADAPGAPALFDYVDGVIEGLNADPAQRFQAFYSTAADYVAAKLQGGLPLPALLTDLFPYGDTPHTQWTGYYSSRPAFKRYVRESSALLQGARQLQALVGGVADTGPTNPLFALERALGVAQHHDAIAGTALQNVNDDYTAALAAGRGGALGAMAQALAAATGYTAAPFAACELGNVSLCQPLEAGQATVALVYNAQGQGLAGAPQRLAVGFPPGVATWAVYDAAGAPVTAQVVPLSPRDAQLRAMYLNASSGSSGSGGAAAAAIPPPVQWLCFVAGALPPAGYAAFFLLPLNATQGAPSTHASTLSPLPPSGSDGSITNGRVTLTIAAATGLVSAYADAATGVALPLAQSWAAYEGFNGLAPLNGSTVASGAYIFRPARSAPDALAPPGQPAQVTLVTGPVVSEAQSTLAYVSATARLWAGAGDGRVEFEYTVGPVDVRGNASREVVVRYSSGLGSGGSWRSDANCRESQPRQRNARGNWSAVGMGEEPVASNYYPAACLATLASSAVTLAVATDSAQGCTSLVDGQLELMVHRRMMHLDGREPLRRELPLNEPGVDGQGLVVRGRHWVLAAPAALAGPAGKALAQQALAAPSQQGAVFFAGLQGASPAQWAGAFRARGSLLRAPLPPNLHLATVHVLGPSTWLLRLAHLYEAGEDAALSGSASVDLATLFAGSTVTAAEDMTLPGALPLAAVRSTRYVTEGGLNVTGPALPAAPAGPGLTVTLTAMQIRTFRCTVAPGAR
jgi:hypothetical protein